MIKKPITIQIPSGLEARSIALLVQVASQYDSRIHVEVGNKRINAKSMMGVMSLNVRSGEEIIVEAEGADEEAAVNDIEKYLSAHE